MPPRGQRPEFGTPDTPATQIFQGIEQLLRAVPLMPTGEGGQKELPLDSHQLLVAQQIFKKYGLEIPESVKLHLLSATKPISDRPDFYEVRYISTSTLQVETFYYATLDAGADQPFLYKQLEPTYPDSPGTRAIERDWDSYSQEDWARVGAELKGVFLAMDIGMDQVLPQEEAALLKLLEQLAA